MSPPGIRRTERRHARRTGRIAPVPGRAEGARAKLAGLGLSEADIAEAVAWARSGGGEADG